MKVLGDVNNKDIVIIDDMVDTGTHKSGPNDGQGSLSVCLLYSVFSLKTHEKLENSSISELVITNTIPKKHKSIKVREVSVTHLQKQFNL